MNQPKEVVRPLNNSHSVIERPELVNLVKPPTIIIRKLMKEILLANKNSLLILSRLNA